MYKVTCGPTAFWDVDDTLIPWDFPEVGEVGDRDLVEIECRGYKRTYAKNKHNIDLLIKFAVRGHAIVVWSGGGADWAEAVVKALDLEQYVEVVSGKPSYYIDDKPNTKEWMGKHGFFDLDGNRIHGDNIPDNK